MKERKVLCSLSNDFWSRLIGIPVVGVFVPLVFYSGDDTAGLLISIALSLVITSFAWLVVPWSLNKIHRQYPWQSHALAHIAMEIALLIGVGTIMSLLMTVPYWIFPQARDSIQSYADLASVYLVIFLILFLITAIYELYYLFVRWKDSLVETEKLAKENALAHYQALRNQVNPHFLFNSLSQLSALVYPHPEPAKAKRYLDEFANIYRYILDSNEEMVVPLHRELAFLQSYMYLLDIRYDGQLTLNQHIAPPCVNYLVPPLCLQLLVENVTKHNRIDAQYPMVIELKTKDKQLVLTNPIQRKTQPRSETRKSLGINNLKQRYALLSDQTPEFKQENNYFICQLPLLEEE